MYVMPLSCLLFLIVACTYRPHVSNCIFCTFVGYPSAEIQLRDDSMKETSKASGIDKDYSYGRVKLGDIVS